MNSSIPPFFALFLAAGSAAAADALPGRLAAPHAEGWVAYDVPMVADAGAPCCFESIRHGKPTSAGCDLDGRNFSYGTTDDPQFRPAATTTLSVYLHLAGGRVDRVRALAGTCPVSAKTGIARLGDVDGAASVRWLADWMDTHATRRDADGDAMAALAYHADPAATSVIGAKAQRSAPFKEREDAIFWLGQTRGKDGAAIVERIARSDADPKAREHAVFSLSETKAVDGYLVIHDIAQHDASEQVRSQALFWMAQMDDARAAADIRAALRSDPSEHVREQAVFALSQLDHGGDAELIAVVRGDYARDAKEKALFWLGQSGSDEAMQFLDDVLTRASPHRDDARQAKPHRGKADDDGNTDDGEH